MCSKYYSSSAVHNGNMPFFKYIYISYFYEKSHLLPPLLSIAHNYCLDVDIRGLRW